MRLKAILEKESPERVRYLLRASGITEHDLRSIQFSASVEESELKLSSFKAKFRTGFRRLVPLLHPDTNPGDAEKAELLRILVVLQKHIEGLRPEVPPVQVVRRGVVISYYPTGNVTKPTNMSAEAVASMRPRRR